MGGEYKYVGGKWKMSVSGVGCKWSDKYIYENYFFDYLNAHEYSGAIIAHLPRGGQSHLKWVPIYVDGFQK